MVVILWFPHEVVCHMGYLSTAGLGILLQNFFKPFFALLTYRHRCSSYKSYSELYTQGMQDLLHMLRSEFHCFLVCMFSMNILTSFGFPLEMGTLLTVTMYCLVPKRQPTRSPVGSSCQTRDTWWSGKIGREHRPIPTFFWLYFLI